MIKKIKNNGFTLVELLVVIILLSVILVFAVPAVQNISTSSNEKLYQTKMDNIIKATNLYVIDNKRCFTRDTSSCSDITEVSTSGTSKTFEMKIKDLAKNSYIEYDEEEIIFDPRSKGSSLNEEVIVIIYSTEFDSFEINPK